MCISTSKIALEQVRSALVSLYCNSGYNHCDCKEFWQSEIGRILLQHWPEDKEHHEALLAECKFKYDV